MQMAQLVATIGTSGDVHRPKIFLRKLPAREVPEPFPDDTMTPVTRRVELRPEYWRALQEGMFQAVNGVGTARRARVKGVDVSGKTGTSQVASRKRIAETRDQERPKHLRNHGWFVGYAPKVNPEIAIAVLVEHGGGGGVAAAPIAQQIMKVYFELRHVPRGDRARKTTMAID
jgi:penicillin-binding protein 2